jgi:hypothetical protein
MGLAFTANLMAAEGQRMRGQECGLAREKDSLKAGKINCNGLL